VLVVELNWGWAAQLPPLPEIPVAYADRVRLRIKLSLKRRSTTGETGMFTIAIIGITVGAAVLVGLHIYPNTDWQELRLKVFRRKPEITEDRPE
jgi:hypothetical protein